MKAVFIESRGFTDWVTSNLPDTEYAALQQRMMDNPDLCDVMAGCGGLRKIRAADPKRGKGKRGGVRVIYLYVPEAKWFFMLDGYGKDEQDDLTAAEKKVLSRLARELKQEAIVANRRRTRRRKR